jgi:hypothetical protein
LDVPGIFAVVGVAVVPGGSVGMFPIIGGKDDNTGGNDVPSDAAFIERGSTKWLDIQQSLTRTQQKLDELVHQSAFKKAFAVRVTNTSNLLL